MALVVAIQQCEPINIDVEFSCKAGDVLAIVGPSGSGKTTLLRCIAGLHNPQNGFISFAGKLWFDAEKKFYVVPQQRQVGFVFQDFALFPHLTVLDNIQLAMPVSSKVGAHQLLARVHLTGLENRKPETLSGGQKQRVALARALAIEPQILLLDEPFSSVDQVTRRKLRLEMLQLTRQLAVPIILVTHDLDEACLLANKMVVLHKGVALQSGEPQVLLKKPANATVARLVDVKNLFNGTVIKHGGMSFLQWEAETLTLPGNPFDNGASVSWCIRSADILLHSRIRPSGGEKENPLTVTIEELMLVGGIFNLIVSLSGSHQVLLHMDLPPHVVERNHLKIGESINISIPEQAIHLMPTVVTDSVGN